MEKKLNLMHDNLISNLKKSKTKNYIYAFIDSFLIDQNYSLVKSFTSRYVETIIYTYKYTYKDSIILVHKSETLIEKDLLDFFLEKYIQIKSDNITHISILNKNTLYISSRRDDRIKTILVEDKNKINNYNLISNALDQIERSTEKSNHIYLSDILNLLFELINVNDIEKMFINTIFIFYEKILKKNKSNLSEIEALSIIQRILFDKFSGYENSQLFSKNNFKYKSSSSFKDYDKDRLPKSWIEGFNESLNGFVYTLNEESSLIAINPSIFGKILETLQGLKLGSKFNIHKKNNGAFYTPSHIVDFMNKEVFVEYLKSFFNEKNEHVFINTLIKSEDEQFNKYFSDSNNEFFKDVNFYKTLIDKINSIKIIDLALGASDFIIPFASLIQRTFKRLSAFPDSTSNSHKLVYNNKGFNHTLSKAIIYKNNLYGVDLQPISIDTSYYRILLDIFNEKTISNFEDTKISINITTGNSLVYKENSKNENSTNIYPGNFLNTKMQLGQEKFDIVVGNPPYINLQSIDDSYKKIYSKQNYSTYSARTDLYVLFYEKGIKILKNHGFLIYITSNKWLKSEYGNLLRNYILDNTTPLKLIDMGSDVFNGATVDTSILLLTKKNLKRKTLTYNYTKNTDLASLTDETYENNKFVRNNTWMVLNKVEKSIIDKINQKSVMINDIKTLKIRRGILTGHNKAFVISEEIKEEILNQCNTIQERKDTEKLIVPLIRGKDIRNCKINWRKLYLINTHNGFHDENGKYISNVVLSKNTAIFSYFSNFQNILKNRTDQGKKFYNLRNCAYISEFEKKKIVWPDISAHPNFTEDSHGYFIANNAYMMTGYPEWMLKYLNSPVFNWYFTKISLSLGTDAHRYTKQFISKAKVPNPLLYSGENIFEFYNFTDEEIDVIKNNS